MRAESEGGSSAERRKRRRWRGRKRAAKRGVKKKQKKTSAIDPSQALERCKPDHKKRVAGKDELHAHRRSDHLATVSGITAHVQDYLARPVWKQHPSFFSLSLPSRALRKEFSGNNEDLRRPEEKKR